MPIITAHRTPIRRVELLERRVKSLEQNLALVVRQLEQHMAESFDAPKKKSKES